jgi:hypothetical protein
MAISGDRSPLFYWGSGAAKPLSTGTYGGNRSLLAFWIGGACGWTFVPRPVAPVPEGGLPFERKRPIIDDAEILEFLQMWVAWQNIE